VPFVVRYPRTVKPRKLAGLTAHVDLMPTLLSLAGAPVPPSLEGKDLTPMLTGQTDSVQDAVFIEIRNDTSIITERWKMGVNPADGFGDLYDRQSDGDDLHNLYDDPKYAAVRKKLTDRLVAFSADFARRHAMGPVKRYLPKAEYRYQGGDARAFFLDEPAPWQAGKTITLTADVEAGDKPLHGVLITADVLSHGYSLHVKNGVLEMGLRRWGTETYVTAPTALPAGRLAIRAVWKRDGAVTLTVNNQQVAAATLDGAIPIQPGRPTARAAGMVNVGRTKKWGRMMGGFKKNTPLAGTLHSLTVNLE